MKIVTLNVWGGRVGEPLLDFFRTHADVDVFLLQEVLHQATERTNWANTQANIFQEIGEMLPGFHGFFAPAVVHEWGPAAYVRASVPLDEVGDVFVHGSMHDLVVGDPASIGRNIQFLKTRFPNGAPLTLLNFHGLWASAGKNDTEDRLNQSRKIIEFAKTLEGEMILCGDFNMNPTTKSLQMIVQEVGLKNLIVDHGISSTRTSLYTKPGKFADYILISPTIKVKAFKVLPDEVSDHAPLFLEI